MEPFWGNNLYEREDFFMWLEDSKETNDWDDLMDAIYNTRFFNVGHWFKLEEIKDEIIERYRKDSEQLLENLKKYKG
jgi:hypothetical protein